MKKEIGEMKLNELKEICRKNVKNNDCATCPLYKFCNMWGLPDSIALNEEIEVEDNDIKRI